MIELTRNGSDNMFLIAKTGIWPWLFDHSDDIGVFLRIGGRDLIRWYAICILTGFILCLFRVKHQLKKQNLPTDYYDNFFFTVIPIAIIGGRLWYVISEPDSFFNGSFWDNFLSIIGYTPGGGFALAGLAVQGAVLFSIAWGCFYMTRIKKQIKLGFHFDLVLPTILIGQIIGRWGNFFNGEVYGKLVERSSLWFIPKFIIDYCTGTGSLSQVGETSVHIPLFFVESMINLVGFILIGVILYNKWHKGRKPYQIGSFYFIWYGTIRLLLEPLRENEYIMSRTIFGLEVRTSILMSIIYIILGVGLFIFAMIYYRNKTLEEGYRNEEYEAKILKQKEEDEAILNKQIEEKKAEIRQRKLKEKEENN